MRNQRSILFRHLNASQHQPDTHNKSRVENKGQRFENYSQVIWKDVGGGNDFSGASVLTDYQVSRFLSHCFSLHHPLILRITRLESEGFTLESLINFSMTELWLSDGLRTMALKNLSSGALSNERVGYYSTDEYSPG